jgi:hypothetical protein
MNDTFKKALAYIGISSSVATFLINAIPDTVANGVVTDNHLGLKILLFIVLGLVVFGVSWARENIENLFNGIIIGILIGTFSGIIGGVIDTSAAKMPIGLDRNFLISLKWIFPILANTYVGAQPWKG